MKITRRRRKMKCGEEGYEGEGRSEKRTWDKRVGGAGA
jgi:hypothetical protein